jgi:hypothetical protein
MPQQPTSHDIGKLTYAKLKRLTDMGFCNVAVIVAMASIGLGAKVDDIVDVLLQESGGGAASGGGGGAASGGGGGAASGGGGAAASGATASGDGGDGTFQKVPVDITRSLWSWNILPITASAIESTKACQILLQTGQLTSYSALLLVYCISFDPENYPKVCNKRNWVVKNEGFWMTSNENDAYTSIKTKIP